MPTKPARACRYPGCPRLTDATYCAAHRAMATDTRRDTRPSAARRGYGRAWQVVRAEVLAEQPVCQVCCQRPATEVDHIRELRDGGTHDRANLRSICRSCHNAKTQRVKRERMVTGR